MDVTFNSAEELYQRILPALTTKKEEMRRNGFPYIKEEDIWNYFKKKKWQNSKKLTLFDIIDDVLNTDCYIIDDFFKKELRTMKRKRYLGEDEEESHHE
ncbi:MAG: post-transcriptional regulator [Bacilli bacterium]|nr:post-transcriptional regulator [Bacilli bacterium]